jgi:hypothetical protein
LLGSTLASAVEIITGGSIFGGSGTGFFNLNTDGLLLGGEGFGAENGITALGSNIQVSASYDEATPAAIYYAGFMSVTHGNYKMEYNPNVIPTLFLYDNSGLPSIRLDSANGIGRFEGTQASTTSATGAVRTPGGLYAGAQSLMAGILRISSTQAASSNTTGALVVSGGAGIAGALYVGGAVINSATTESTNTTSGAMRTAGGLGVAKNLHVGGNTYGAYYTKAGTQGLTETKTFTDGSAGYHTVEIVGGIIVNWTIS